LESLGAICGAGPCKIEKIDALFCIKCLIHFGFLPQLLRLHDLSNEEVLFEFSDDRLSTLYLLIELFIFGFPMYYRFIDAHLGLDLGFYAVKKAVNKADNACLLIEV
jgi:hypothetical protein